VLTVKDIPWATEPPGCGSGRRSGSLAGEADVRLHPLPEMSPPAARPRDAGPPAQDAVLVRSALPGLCWAQWRGLPARRDSPHCFTPSGRPSPGSAEADSLTQTRGRHRRAEGPMRPPTVGVRQLGGGPGSSRTHAGGCQLLRIAPTLTVGQDRSKTYSSNPACVKTHVQMYHNSRESRPCRDFLVSTTELLLMGVSVQLQIPGHGDRTWRVFLQTHSTCTSVPSKSNPSWDERQTALVYIFSSPTEGVKCQPASHWWTGAGTWGGGEC